MRRLVPLTIAMAVTVLPWAPGGARAAPINECGRLGGPGYAVFIITSRVVGCTKARAVARAYYKGRWTNLPRRQGQSFRRGSYTCRYRLQGIEGVDMRCTASGGRVVRFPASS